MKKKTWIKVKRGLLDTKHRTNLGIRVWLYLHILDRADWETGKVLEWSDKCEADELEMPLETLRSQRRQLEEDGYITAVKGQYSQQIIIHNWTDPRKYDGEVINQSGNNQPLSEEVQSVNSEESLAELEPELQSELYPESLKVNTHSLISHNTSHKSQKRLKDSSPKNGDGNGRPAKDEYNRIRRRAEDKFYELTHCIPFPDSKTMNKRVWMPLIRICDLVQWREDDVVALLQATFNRMKGLTYDAPDQWEKTARSIVGEAKRGAYKPSYSFESEMQKFMDWRTREVQSG